MEKRKWQAFFISAAERILFCGVFVLAAAAKPLLKFFQLEYGKPQHEICGA